MIELVAVAVTLVAVWLTTRQNVWCWPVSLVSVSLYAWVFYGARLYADTGLQGLYFGLSVYGWWAWTRGGPDHGELQVATATPRVRLGLLAVGVVGGLVLGSTLERFTDASLPFMDSLLTSFSVVAQWLQTRKLLEAWVVWFTVDVFYVGMFLYKGLVPTAGLYAVFLVLAGSGFVQWRRSLPAPGVAAPALP